MRYTIELEYDAAQGEDVGAVGRVLAEMLSEQDGVMSVTVHGEEAHIVTRPGFDPIHATATEA